MPRPLAGALLTLTLIATSPAVADEITVPCPRGVQAPLAALAERFGADTGHRVRFAFGTAGALARRAAEGEAAPLAIFSGAASPPRERAWIWVASASASR